MLLKINRIRKLIKNKNKQQNEKFIKNKIGNNKSIKTDKS
jgi:hypothetical protein